MKSVVVYTVLITMPWCSQAVVSKLRLSVQLPAYIFCALIAFYALARRWKDEGSSFCARSSHRELSRAA